MRWEIDGGEIQTPVRIKLVQDGSVVYLVALDNCGRYYSGNYILKFNEDGTFSRCSSCCVQGLRLDPKGKIEEGK